MNWKQWMMWSAWALAILGALEALALLGIWNVWSYVGASANVIAGVLFAVAAIVYAVSWFMGRSSSM